MIFLSLLAIPLLIAVGWFVFTKKVIMWQEFLGHVGIAVVLAGISTGLMYCSNTHDVEVWGGKVTSKKREKVSCEHDYCCMTCQSCSTDSKGNTTCTDYCCQTCYDHPFDVDWSYWTSDAGHGRIRRLDRQGLKEPPRWTTIEVGEPSSSSHGFTNYIKGSPDSLFNRQGLVERFQSKLPNYPGSVYDYYKIDRLVTVGVGVNNPKRWNELLMEQNGRLGASKQVAMGIVLVSNQPRDYYHALAQHWLGGKKNDAFLVVSVDKQNNIQWVEVMAWSENKQFQVQARDAILELGSIQEPDTVINAFAGAVNKYFQRKPMADFEYLASSVKPKPWQWVLAAIINILASIGLGLFFHMNEFREGSSLRRGYSYNYRRRRW